jgi:hypothetical protein
MLEDLETEPRSSGVRIFLISERLGRWNKELKNPLSLLNGRLEETVNSVNSCAATLDAALAIGLSVGVRYIVVSRRSRVFEGWKGCGVEEACFAEKQVEAEMDGGIESGKFKLS